MGPLQSEMLELAYTAAALLGNSSSKLNCYLVIVLFRFYIDKNEILFYTLIIKIFDI